MKLVDYKKVFVGKKLVHEFYNEDSRLVEIQTAIITNITHLFRDIYQIHCDDGWLHKATREWLNQLANAQEYFLTDENDVIRDLFYVDEIYNKRYNFTL